MTHLTPPVEWGRMCYRLRTLLILLALSPPFFAWFGPKAYHSLFGKVPLDLAFPCVADGELNHEGRSYGAVCAGDTIRISRNRLYVNGKLRPPE